MSVPGNGAVPGEVTPAGIPTLTNHSGRKFSHYPTKPPLVPVEVFYSAPNQHQAHLGIRAEPRWDIAFLIPSLSRFFPLPSFSRCFLLSPGVPLFPLSFQEFPSLLPALVLPFPPPLFLQLPGLHPGSQGAFPSPCPTFPGWIPGFFPQGFICLLQYSLSPSLSPHLQMVFLPGLEQGRGEWGHPLPSRINPLDLGEP